MSGFTLAHLGRIGAERGRSGDPQSWTAKLFSGGIDKAAQKLGEEAVETVIGAVGTVVLGIVLFGEPATVARLACVGLILAGIVGLKLTA